MRPRPYTILFLICALAGFVFASYSTSDFVAHLDRQVHSIHCSFTPGLVDADVNAASGCHKAMMSPYSSVLRSTLWGGIPISLGAMSVFAFLLFRGLDLMVNKREDDKGATGFVALAAALPFLTSMGMAYISATQIGEFCKVCMGIYASSTLGLIFAVLNWRAADLPRLGQSPYGLPPVSESTGMVGHVVSFVTGVVFVLVPVLVYIAVMPDYSKYIGTCGSLPHPEDSYSVFVPIGQQAGGKATIEVFDPLCPACRGFEDRLDASGLAPQLKRQAVLFPLDMSCNWMAGSTLHPGACTISEAVLCADKKADAVIDWAFEHQDEVKAAAEKDPTAAATMVTAAFPDLKACIGSAAVKTKLNRSLRWAVQNQLPVLTPQIYVEGEKLCDEDTDLGMDYALSRLITKPAAAPAKEGK